MNRLLLCLMLVLGFAPSAFAQELVSHKLRKGETISHAARLLTGNGNNYVRVHSVVNTYTGKPYTRVNDKHLNVGDEVRFSASLRRTTAHRNISPVEVCKKFDEPRCAARVAALNMTSTTETVDTLYVLNSFKSASAQAATAPTAISPVPSSPITTTTPSAPTSSVDPTSVSKRTSPQVRPSQTQRAERPAAAETPAPSEQAAPPAPKGPSIWSNFRYWHLTPLLVAISVLCLVTARVSASNKGRLRKLHEELAFHAGQNLNRPPPETFRNLRVAPLRRKLRFHCSTEEEAEFRRALLLYADLKPLCTSTVDFSNGGDVDIGVRFNFTQANGVLPHERVKVSEYGSIFADKLVRPFYPFGEKPVVRVEVTGRNSGVLLIRPPNGDDKLHQQLEGAVRAVTARVPQMAVTRITPSEEIRITFRIMETRGTHVAAS